MGEQIDLETQLRRYADQVEAAVGPVRPAAPRRRRLPLLAGAAAIALAGALGGYLLARTDDADLQIEPADVPEQPDAPAQPTTTLGDMADDDLAESEGVEAREVGFGEVSFAPREAALLEPTADAVIVWGGSAPGGDPFTDGAVFDLAAGEWQAMSDGPLPAIHSRPLAAPIGDGQLLVTRLVHTGPFDEDESWSAAAIYDVGADEWVSLPDAPFALNDLVTAPEVDSVFGIGDNEVVRFDIKTITWESTGPFAEWELVEQNVIPVNPNLYPSVVWSGTELVAVAGAIDGTFPIQTWTPGGEWVARGTIATGRSQVALDAAWVDGEVWVVGYDMTVDAWDPATGESRSLPDLPIRFQEGTPTIHALADGRVVIERSPGLAVWTGTGWEVEPYPSGPRRTIGPGLVGQSAAWSLSLVDPDGGPQTLRVAALPRPGEVREVLIGALVLTLEPEESIGSLHADDFGVGGVSVITLRIDHRDPALGCTFTTLYGERSITEGQVFTSGEGLGYDCGDGIDRFLDRFRSVWPEEEPAFDGEETIVVPQVVGLFFDTAEATLRSIGLEPVVEFVTVPFGDPQVGLVVEQTPEPGATVVMGSEIVIRVGEAGPAPEE